MELTSKIRKLEVTESDHSQQVVSVKLTIEGAAATAEQVQELASMVGKALVIDIELLQAEMAAEQPPGLFGKLHPN